MNPNIHIFIGVILALIGGTLWYKQADLYNAYVLVSILFILVGAVNLILGFNQLESLKPLPPNQPIQTNSLSPKSTSPSFTFSTSFLDWLFIIGLIFLGSVSYTIAAYYHLQARSWSFLLAFSIAVPFILIEYQFSLRGNYYAQRYLKFNAVQIAIITMVFYFVNAWILNHFILKQKVVFWRELLAFALIIAAFMITTHQE